MGVIQRCLGTKKQHALEKFESELTPFWKQNAPANWNNDVDPLSPYLFVICMEILSHKIQVAVDEKEWKVARVTRFSPPGTDLFFVDYLLLFGEASMRQTSIMKQILESFCMESGQKVNLTKS